MSRLQRTVSFFFSFLLVSETASACTCVQLSQSNSRAAAFAIFEGEAIDIHYFEPLLDKLGSSSRTRVTFHVLRYWKGPAESTIQVHAWARALMCDSYQFEIGKRYIVYAMQQDKEGGWADQYPAGTKILVVGSCILRIMTDLPAEERLLGSGLRPKRN